MILADIAMSIMTVSAALMLACFAAVGVITVVAICFEAVTDICNACNDKYKTPPEEN